MSRAFSAQAPLAVVPPLAHEGPAPRTDDELIDAVVSGDERVAREFHDRLLPVIERSIDRVLRGRTERHVDLVQVAFEQVVESLSRNKFARACSLKTWAARIAARVALQALRDRYRERRTSLDDDVGAHIGPTDVENEADVRGRLRWVQAQLATMAPRRAEVLLLHDLEGYELGEVALMMGISASSAQSLLVRARQQIMREHERALARAKLRREART